MLTVVWRHDHNPENMSYRSCALLGETNQIEAVVTFNPRIKRIKVKDQDNEMDIHIGEKLTKAKLAKLLGRYTRDDEIVSEIFDQYEKIYNSYFC